MQASRRASPMLAAALVCGLFPEITVCRANSHQTPGRATPSPPAVAGLVTGLEHWLDRESPYTRRYGRVTVRFVGAKSAARAATAPAYQGATLRGYYDPRRSTIYLVEPWSPDNPFDVSTLLHELVHHRQQSATYWECPNAQERPAYRLQDRWLRERGLDSHINWLVVLMASRCRSGPFGGD